MSGPAASVLLKIGGDDSAFAKVVGRAQARLQAFSRQIQGMGNRVSGWGKGLAVGAGVIAAPFVGAVQQFVSAGDALDKLSGRVGVSVESLSELKYAAEQSGATIGDVESALTNLSKRLEKGGGATGTWLERIGLTFADMEGLSPETAFERIAGALNGVDDASLKTAASMNLLGTTKLSPMIADMQTLRQEARSLGVVMSTEQAKAAAELSSAFGRVTATVKSVAYSVGNALAPTITDLANRAASVISTVRAWVDGNQALIRSVVKGIAIALALGAGLLALGSAITVVGVGISSVASLMGLLAAVTTAVLSPIGLLVAGIAGGGYAFATMTESGRKLVEFFQNEFSNLYGIVKPIIDSIVSAFKMGDFSMAAAIAFAGVKIPALQLWGFLRGLWNDGVFYLGAMWDEIAFGMLKAWTIVKSGLTWDFLKLGFLHVAKFISDVFSKIISGIVDGFLWMVNQIASILYATRIIGDKTLVDIDQKTREISKSVKGMGDSNSQFYQREIDAVNRGIENSDGGRELKALEDAKQHSIRERVQANLDSHNEAQQAIVAAQEELRELMRQQAEAAASYTPAEPGEAVSPVERALSIDTSRISADLQKKTDVGSSASFSATVAGMLANNNKNRIDEMQLDVLKQIAENTEDISLGYGD